MPCTILMQETYYEGYNSYCLVEHLVRIYHLECDKIALVKCNVPCPSALP